MEMERYRSGHNEAALKSVCPQGRVGSNPTLSVGEISLPDIKFGMINKNYIYIKIIFINITYKFVNMVYKKGN